MPGLSLTSVLFHSFKAAAFVYRQSVSLDSPTKKDLCCSLLVLLRNAKYDWVLEEKVSFGRHSKANVRSPSHDAESYNKSQLLGSCSKDITSIKPR